MRTEGSCISTKQGVAMSTRKSIKTVLGTSAVAFGVGVAGLTFAGAVSAGTPDRSVSCDAPSADLVTLDKKSPSEPLLRVLQPTGWVRGTDAESKAVRLVLTAKFGDEVSGALVGVIKGPAAPAAKADRGSADLVLEEVTVSHKKVFKANGSTSVDTTVCGNPARMVTFDSPLLGRAQELMVYVPGPCDSYVAALAVYSSNPKDVQYQAAVDSMMSRFQVVDVNK